MTRPLLALLALSLLEGDSSNTHLRYQRAVRVTQPGQSCAVLDPALYTHAAASLADLRLTTKDGAQEIPFVLLRSGSLQTETENARIVNVHQAGKSLLFDLAMPPRPYTDVMLLLNAPNRLAQAVVTTEKSSRSSLGEFTLFDLTAQHLTGDTTLHLQETAAPLLHVTLRPLPESSPITPAMLLGASVPPSREAQTLFTPALRTSSFEQTRHQTIARFTVPAHLPIERVRIVLAAGKTPNLTRPVLITSHVSGESESSGEQIRGTIARVRSTRGGTVLSLDQLSLPAILGANLQRPAEVEVAIENANDPPLPLASVVLETRQRQICFDLSAAAPLTLFYGDPALEPPQYDYQQHFRPDPAMRNAVLGPEQANPHYVPREDTRSLTKRHPRMLALGTMLVVCLVAVLTLRSKKLRV